MLNHIQGTPTTTVLLASAYGYSRCGSGYPLNSAAPNAFRWQGWRWLPLGRPASPPLNSIWGYLIPLLSLVRSLLHMLTSRSQKDGYLSSHFVLVILNSKSHSSVQKHPRLGNWYRSAPFLTSGLVYHTHTN